VDLLAPAVDLSEQLDQSLSDEIIIGEYRVLIPDVLDTIEDVSATWGVRKKTRSSEGDEVLSNHLIAYTQRDPTFLKFTKA
jgi:hypothetical protein